MQWPIASRAIAAVSKKNRFSVGPVPIDVQCQCVCGKVHCCSPDEKGWELLYRRRVGVADDPAATSG
jgi:hypothetical protein